MFLLSLHICRLNIFLSFHFCWSCSLGLGPVILLFTKGSYLPPSPLNLGSRPRFNVPAETPPAQRGLTHLIICASLWSVQWIWFTLHWWLWFNLSFFCRIYASLTVLVLKHSMLFSITPLQWNWRRHFCCPVGIYIGRNCLCRNLEMLVNAACLSNRKCYDCKNHIWA